MSRYTIIRGLPQSGKTYKAKHDYGQAILIEPDMYHVFNGNFQLNTNHIGQARKWAQSTASYILNSFVGDVVVCDTCRTLDILTQWIELSMFTIRKIQVITIGDGIEPITVQFKHSHPNVIFKNVRAYH